MRRRAEGPGSSRGRPQACEHRDVVGDIKLATEAALNDRSPGEITLRQIADAAGTTEAMIQYYFGSKDGLLVAMCADLLDRLPVVFHASELYDSCIAQRSIFPFVEAAAAFYASRPGLVRMIVAELIRGSSEVQNTYRRKYSARRANLIGIAITRLIEAGVYRCDANPRLIIIGVMSLRVFPISLERTFSPVGEDHGEFQNGVWTHLVAEMFDRQFSTCSR